MRGLKPIKDNRRWKADKYDLIADHIIFGKPLENQVHQELLAKARQIWPIICEELTTKAIVAKIVKLEIAKSRQAHNLVMETEKIFGRARRNNKEGRIAMLIEIAMRTMKDAREAGKYEVVDRLIDRIAKLENLYERDTGLGNVYQTLILQPIQLTDNPRVIEAQQISVETDE